MAKKKKVISGEADSRLKKDVCKEKFVFSTWDSLLLDFLTAIQEAGIEARQTQGNFTEILQVKLRSNGDLVTKIKAKPKLAERVVNSLPCGHRTCYAFIREVCQMRK